jgi:hypothetical protein
LSIESDNSAIGDGALARLLLTNLSPILESLEKESKARYLSEFKLGTLNEAKCLAYFAELGILENIENRLKSRITKADRVSLGRVNDSRNTDEY